MKRYTISEVANMFGLSSEALRNYERKGLISPLRSKNGYRSYTKPDIYILNGLRLLRNSGYSLDDIDLLYNATLEQTIEIKQKRCLDMEAEIAYEQLKLTQMCKELNELKALHNGGDPCICRVNSPAMLRINNQIDDIFHMNNACVRRWMEHLPIVRISPAFRKEAILKGHNEIRFGYVVPMDLGIQLGLDKTPDVEIKETRDCLTTIVYSFGEKFLDTSTLANSLSYCRENGLMLAGDIWGITICTCIKDNAQIRYHRMYIPVANM